MYFRAKNGSYKRVPQLANEGVEQANGGMTIYYMSPNDRTSKVTAFKPVRLVPHRHKLETRSVC